MDMVYHSHCAFFYNSTFWLLFLQKKKIETVATKRLLKWISLPHYIIMNHMNKTRNICAYLTEMLDTSQHNTNQDQALLHLRSQIPQSDAYSIDKLRRAKKSQDCELFSFSDIVAATGNFALANKLGEGGFGPVYKVSFKVNELSLRLPKMGDLTTRI